MEKKVAIIISTYNQKDLSELCLKSVFDKTDYEDYKIFFIDDSGTKEIGEEIKRKFRKIDVSSNGKNLGFSKSNNIGIKEAIKEYNPDYFLLLNDDTEIIQKDWLKKMVAAGEGDNKIGILGCRLVYPNGDLQNLGGYLRGWQIIKISSPRKEKLFDVDHVMGAFLMIKKEVINKIGMLDEVYSPFLLEDTDFCLRAKEAGFSIKTVNSVEVIHKKGKSIDTLANKKILSIRFKNDIIFSLRHMTFGNALFRIFVYLPLTAIFKKKSDEDSLRLKNFVLRRDFLTNLYTLIKSYILVIKIEVRG